MKKTFTIILIIVCCHVFAQDSLKSFNESHNHITISGMEVLGSWAIANIGVGTVGWARSAGGANKYFYQMNILWNTANLGAAILGFTGAEKDKNRQFTRAETLNEQQKIERIFLVNGGLDVAYIGTGLYLKLHGDIKNSNLMRGYGSSIMLQGAFLLLFDTTMYNTQRHNGSKLRRFLENPPVTFNGKTVGIIYNM